MVADDRERSEVVTGPRMLAIAAVYLVALLWVLLDDGVPQVMVGFVVGIGSGAVAWAFYAGGTVTRLAVECLPCGRWFAVRIASAELSPGGRRVSIHTAKEDTDRHRRACPGERAHRDR